MSKRKRAFALVAVIFAGCNSSATSSKPIAPLEHHGDAKTAGKEMPQDHMQMGAPGKLTVKTEPAEIKPGEPTKLSMMVHDSSGAPVKDFDTVHEQKMHLIIVSEGLDFFAHIHPEIDDKGSLSTSFPFPMPGNYWLYADHKPAGKPQAVAMATLTVPGAAPPKAPHTPSVPGETKMDDLTAAIETDGVKAGAKSRITFSLSDPAGKPITDLKPYLGAMGHLVIISDDGKDFVHAHPVDGAKAGGPIAFEAHFPRPGIYGGWAEFQRANTVHTVPFIVEVK
jgi:hypothetical protein